MRPNRLNSIEQMFLWLETRETMMHVAGLTLFKPPPDAPPDYVGGLWKSIREERAVYSPWNLKLRTPNVPKNPLQAWVVEESPDLDYNVRRSALPAPGDERELGVLVSRLHSNAVDLHRPPWELHFIEGLERNRFAFYVKIHHALVDGMTGMRLLVRSLSTDPAERTKPIFFAVPEKSRPPRASAPAEEPLDFWSLVRAARQQAGIVKNLSSALLDLGLPRRGKRAQLTSPLQAPASVLNARIGRNRRFATQRIEIDRLKRIAKSSGGTLNDVVVAMCAGGLRRFLLELGQLPDKPLVAFLPVSLHAKTDGGGSGNAVGAILASMATDLEGAKARLDAIIASTARAKEQLKGLSQSGMLAYSMALLSPGWLQGLAAMGGFQDRVPMTFNVCISNVPGPDQPLYFRGAQMEASYPVSIPIHGMALNITCQSSAGILAIGFVGCRDTLPHLQRLAVYTGEALTELER
jgi:diacylglycerol O-acyltransferase